MNRGDSENGVVKERTGSAMVMGHTNDPLLAHAQSPHLDQVLRYLRDPLLALVRDEVRPVYQLLIDLPSNQPGLSTSKAGKPTCSRAFE